MINISQKKIFFILILSIFVVLAGSIFWFVHRQTQTHLPISISKDQKPEETFIDKHHSTSAISDFKTYRNEEFGFELKYPAGWIIVREDKFVNYYSKLLIVMSKPVTVMSKKGFDEAFIINIVLPEFIRGFNDLEKNVHKIIVDNVPGVKYEYVFNDSPETTVILPLKQYKIILGTGGGSKQYLDEFNQILATFKFLK